MLDIKLIRNNPEILKKAFSRRNEYFDIDNFLTIVQKRKDVIIIFEQLKNKQNITSKLIPEYKKKGKDISQIMEEMKELSEKIKELDLETRKMDEEIEKIMLTIPNIPNETVPLGNTDEDNIEIRKYGEIKKYNFEIKPHWEIGENLNILDFGRAAKTTGARFTFYKGLGARLERALMNFMLDLHTDKHGYTEIFPPFIVNRNSMTGTGQLPKFEEDTFKIENTDYFLIPTAEVPVTNLYRDEIIDIKDLPIKYVAYSACFRAEAGAAGRDTRGLIRQHQFNKVELVKFSLPESSYEELEKLTKDAEEVLKLLGIPYRVVKICIGDLGFAAAMKYDLEVWMPSYNKYVEISSCSNFETFQSRRAQIRFRRGSKEKLEFVHTLNGSGLALGRTTACILESFQQQDGSVIIPDVLVKYMNGIKEIKRV